MENEKLPDFLRPLFWDVDFGDLNIEKDRDFLIKRVLDRGDTVMLKWLRLKCSDVEISNVVKKTRELSMQTANFWSDIFKLDKSQVLCLQKPYSPIPFGLSS